jgi:predicted transcriptional regulator
VSLAIRLPKSLKKRLQLAALEDDTTAQAITRAAIEEYLDRRAKGQGRRRPARG